MSHANELKFLNIIKPVQQNVQVFKTQQLVLFVYNCMSAEQIIVLHSIIYPP